MKRVLALVMTLCLAFTTVSFAARGADKYYALTMGVHKYAGNNTVVDASGIASVTYYRHKDGSTGSANHIYDIAEGEQFTLTTEIRQEQKEFFTFLCWLDEYGTVIGKEPTLEITVDRSRAAFATYVENASRHLLTYKIVGEGSVSVSSDHQVFSGYGCVSLLHGASAEIHFAPGKGGSAYYIKVDGEKVAFLPNALEQLGAAVKGGKIKAVFQALLNIVKFYIGKEAVYTIKRVEHDCTFEVGFMRSPLAYR